MASPIRVSIIVGAAAGVLAVVTTQRARLVGAVRALVRRVTGGPATAPDTAENEVQRNSEDSFPASDPPSYGPGL